MKLNGYGSPYRPPADGWIYPKQFFMGGLYQHQDSNLNNLPKYINVTVDASGSRPATAPAIVAEGSCEEAEGTGTWFVSGSFNLSDFPNTFEQTGSNSKGLACRLIGGKWVQAVVQWYGAYPWTCNDMRGCNDVDCGGGTTYLSYQSSPCQVKYLKLHVDVEYFIRDNDDGTHTTTYHSIREWEIDKLSGITTVNAASDDSVDHIPTEPDTIGHGVAPISADLCSIPSQVASGLARLAPGGDQNGVDPAYFAASYSLTDTVITFTYADNGGISRQEAGLDPIEMETLTGTYTLSMPFSASQVYVDGKTLLSYWDLSDDLHYPYRTDGLWQIAPLVSRNQVQSNVTLSPTQTAITGYVSGSGDAILWVDPLSGSYDGKILGMPIVDALSNPDSAIYNPSFSPDTNGDYQDFFDYLNVVYKACQYFIDGAGPYVDFYQAGFGEWLYDAITRTGAQLPHDTTQWTNNLYALDKRPYAWIIFNDPETYDISGTPSPDTDFTAPRGDALWMQKCVEVKELWPSQNFARPAGADKFAYAEISSSCVSNTSGSGEGSTWSITDAFDNVIGDGFVDSDGVWGGQSVDGFYTGCTNASGVLTLGTKVYNLPTDWSNASADEDTSFGRLRFPDCPSILGRVNIKGITDITSSRQLNIDASPYLGLSVSTSESVDICAGNMSVLASNVPITRIDDSNFTVPTAYSTIKTAQYLVNHSASAYYWNDNGSKGDFVIHEWLNDYRTNGENARLTGSFACDGVTPLAPGANRGWATYNQTQEALPFIPCYPSVIAITPNGESWPNAVVYPFPDTFIFDEKYGSKWQAEIEQAMTDIYYQTPHIPCGSAAADTWNMDDGTCKADAPNTGGGEDRFYIHPPLVEARIDLPSNGGASASETAPALPAGVSIGYKSPVDYDDGLLPLGQIGYDPTTGNPSPSFTFWGYKQTIENNSCFPSFCRFNYIGSQNLPCTGGTP